jgi:hypothetical protein
MRIRLLILGKRNFTAARMNIPNQKIRASEMGHSKGERTINVSTKRQPGKARRRRKIPNKVLSGFIPLLFHGILPEGQKIPCTFLSGFQAMLK